MPSPLNIRGRLAQALQPALPAPAPPAPTLPAESPAIADRQDNNGLSSVGGSRSGASMFNMLSGLGGARDSGSMARPNIQREYLAYEELLAMMRGGLYRRIVHLLPDWSTWKGWSITDESEEAEPLAQEMKTLGVQHAFRKADRLARGFGEALIWPVTVGDRGDLSRPLRPMGVRSIRALHVLDVTEFSVAKWETNPESPRWGMPQTYWLHPRRQGLSVTQEVHASRLLYFGGHPLPPSEYGQRYATLGGAGMSDAVGQVMWDALRNMAMTSASGAKLAQELSVAVFTIQNLASKQGSDQSEQFMKRAMFINLMKSVTNSIFLRGGKIPDTYERKAANPAGFKDLSQDSRLQLALITGIPAALLFGEAPSGLSTDEKSWWANWTATVSQHQEDRYRSPLEWLCTLLYLVRYKAIPDQWKLEFNPLGELSQKELADIRKTHAESDALDIKSGILSPTRIRRSRYGAEGYQHEIQPPTPEEEREEAALAPHAEETPSEVPGSNNPQIPEDPDGEPASRQADPPAGLPANTDARSDAEDTAVLALELPVGVGFEAAQSAAQRLLGELELEEWPHVTVLYLGRLGSAVSALRRVAESTVQDFLEETMRSRIVMSPERVGHFGDGTPGPDGVPVLIRYNSWELEELQLRLLRALADKVNVPQYPRFIPHATLGYLKRKMTREESAMLAGLQVDELRVWSPGALALRVGGEVVARIPLVSGRLDEEE